MTREEAGKLCRKLADKLKRQGFLSVMVLVDNRSADRHAVGISRTLTHGDAIRALELGIEEVKRHAESASPESKTAH